MAKIESIFKTTEKPAGKAKPIGVLLTPADIEKLNSIAGELDESRHKILQFAVRKFINDYRAGNIEVETTTQTIKKLKL